MKYIFNDGGRSKAGYKGFAGDCVTRAIAIAGNLDYEQVYKELSRGMATQRKTKSNSARNGVNTTRKWFKDWMTSHGWKWTPTMLVGQGCKVHLHDGELPGGTLIVSLSKHYTCVLDGVIHDTFDPQREVHCVEPDHGQPLKLGQWRNQNGVCSIQRRCVCGYWSR